DNSITTIFCNPSHGSLVGSLSLSEHEPPPLWLRDCIAEFLRGFDPELRRFANACQRLLVRRTVRHAARQFRDFRDERLVVLAPVDDDLVLIHHNSLAKPYSTMIRRTWRT